MLLPPEVIQLIAEEYVAMLDTARINRAVFRRKKAEPVTPPKPYRDGRFCIVPLLITSREVYDTILPVIYRNVVITSHKLYFDFLSYPRTTSYRHIKSIYFTAHGHGTLPSYPTQQTWELGEGEMLDSLHRRIVEKEKEGEVCRPTCPGGIHIEYAPHTRSRTVSSICVIFPVRRITSASSLLYTPRVPASWAASRSLCPKSSADWKIPLLVGHWSESNSVFPCLELTEHGKPRPFDGWHYARYEEIKTTLGLPRASRDTFSWPEWVDSCIAFKKALLTLAKTGVKVELGAPVQLYPPKRYLHMLCARPLSGKAAKVRAGDSNTSEASTVSRTYLDHKNLTVKRCVGECSEKDKPYYQPKWAEFLVDLYGKEEQSDEWTQRWKATLQEKENRWDNLSYADSSEFSSSEADSAFGPDSDGEVGWTDDEENEAAWFHPAFPM